MLFVYEEPIRIEMSPVGTGKPGLAETATNHNATLT